MALPNTFSGSRAVFFVGDTPVAFAGGVSGEEMIDYEPVDVLNLLEVKEHVPVAYRTSLNSQIFRLVGKSLKQRGILPAQADILSSGALNAAIRDSEGKADKDATETIQLFEGVRCSGHSWDVTARGIVQENVTFVAIRVKDEFDLT